MGILPHYTEKVREKQTIQMRGYKVRNTDFDDLTKANYTYMRNLEEMNHEIIEGLSHSIITSIKREAEDLLEMMFEKYKGKLIENLLEINFLQSLQDIADELSDENPFEEKPETTFLYIIEGKDSRKIKIGISKNIDSRLANLQTSNPEELEVINQMEFDYRSEAVNAEAMLHEYLKDFRIMPKGKSTEWFRPEIRKYVNGLGKRHLPQIAEIIKSREQRSAEAMKNVNIIGGEIGGDEDD